VVYELYDVVNESRRCGTVNGVCADIHVRQTHVRVYADMEKRNERDNKEESVSDENHDAGAFYYDVCSIDETHSTFIRAVRTLIFLNQNISSV